MLNDPPNSSPAVQRLGRYQVRSELGRGAMGQVYLARDEELGREVAIKTIHGAIRGTFRDEVQRERFRHEARAVAALSHPNIVPVYDIGFEGELPFLVMEVARGESLRERLDRQGTMPIAELRALGIQMGQALMAAHEQGVLHRDLKPANILQAREGIWKLTDFGVARVPDSTVTLEGQFVGTPSYSAPEALAEGAFSPASDVYGLGATLYEALVGEPPFGRQGLGVLSPERTVPSLASRRHDVPSDLDALVLSTLRRNPEERPSAAELVHHLAMASSRAPAAGASPAPSRARWVLAALVLLGIGIGVGRDCGDEHRAVQPRASEADKRPAHYGEEDDDDDETSDSPARSPRQEKHWRKAGDKLERGDLRGAERELEKLLREDPYDEEARELLERIDQHYEDQEDSFARGHR